jgi:hypothetical protein
MADRPAQHPYGRDLEAALADLATAIAFPPTPDLARSVGERLRQRPAVVGRPHAARRTLIRSLLLAAAVALLLAGAALAVRLGLDLLSIEFGSMPPAPSAGAAHLPTASGSPAIVPGSRLALGAERSLDEVRTEAGFTVALPEGLASPTGAYLGGPSLRGQVSLVYGPTDDLPASALLDGAGLLVTQNRGGADDGLAHKLVEAGLATVRPVVVDDARGLWITGPPHVFWYLAPDGTVIEDSRRLVGDALVWERDGILYRIEGEIPLERALEIARSMRVGPIAPGLGVDSPSPSP